MKYILLISIFLFACSTTKEAQKESRTNSQKVDCSAPTTQKLITFCVSPQASKHALRNIEFKNAKNYEEAFSPIPIRDSPFLGPKDALVSVVMFTDLQCPFCKGAHKTLVKLAKEKKIRLVFKHSPMQFHELAIPAALGAMAAAEQNKFWEFVDLTYSSQESLSLSKLSEFAKKSGVKMDEWKSAFGNNKALSKLENDIVLSRSIGVDATPTMFINGVRIVGLFPEKEVRALVNTQNILAEKLLEAGVKREDIYWRMLSVNYQKPAITSEESEDPEKIIVQKVPVKGAPIMGATGEDVLVTIVEFSDFQCPSCQNSHLWTQRFMKENMTDTRLVFHHFPLPFHEDADGAAIASMVAQHYGKFWVFHDVLFPNQHALQFEKLVEYAKSVGISKSKFKRRFQKSDLADRLADEMELATKLGVKGTPTYFVNGIMVFGLPVDGSFEALVKSQKELAKKIKKEKKLSGEELYQELVRVNQETFSAP